MTVTEAKFDSATAARTLALSLGSAIALWLFGRGVLTTPRVESWRGFQDWLGGRSTAAAAFASLRATGVAVALYVGAVSLLSIVAAATSSVALGHLARSIAPRSIRPLVGVAIGAGLATAAASATVPRSTSSTQIATLVLDPPSDATATMYVVSETSPASTNVVSASMPANEIPPELLIDPTPPPVAVPAVEVPAPVAVPRTWTIERGDHLWAVARETLTDSWQRPPTDGEVVPYWRELIERNRHRLIDPSSPDYVVPGQVFELPDVPARP